MAHEFQRLVLDTFGAHIVYFDHVDLADPKIYLEHIRQSARQHLERDLWEALYVEGVTHPTQIRLSAYHYARTCAAIHGEMMRLVTSDVEFQEIELRAILREPVPVPLVVPEQVVPDIVIPKPQPIVDIQRQMMI